MEVSCLIQKITQVAVVVKGAAKEAVKEAVKGAVKGAANGAVKGAVKGVIGNPPLPTYHQILSMWEV